jgi:hypothetical protein
MLKRMTLFFKQIQRMLHKGYSRKGTLRVVLFLLSSVLLYNSQAFAISIIANSIIMESGTDCGIATYRISTDTTFDGQNLDLILEITDEDNDLAAGSDCVSLDSGNILFKVKDNDGAANPEGWMNATVTVVQQGTTTPVTVDRLVITGFDLDINGGGGTDTDDMYLSNPDGSFLSVNTNVTYSEGSFFGGAYTAKLKGQTTGNCNDGQASPDPACRASAIILNTPSVNFRIQNDNAYSGAGNQAYQRWFFASFRVENLDSLINQDRDYGDAPNTHPSTSQHITAYRALGNGLIPDGEAANQPSAESDGDDNDGAGSAIMFDDEDGVFLSGSPLNNQYFILGSSVNLDISTLSSGYLNGWVDWNGDNDFDDAGEQIITNQHIVNTGEVAEDGTPTLAATNPITNTTIAVTTPAGAIEGTTVARFKFTEAANPGNSGDNAQTGEVEDYRIIVTGVGTLSGTVTDSAGAALANVTITLQDASGNTVSDVNGQPLTTTTDGNGDYSFANVPTGDYFIVETDPAGYTTTRDEDTSADGDAETNASPLDNTIPVTITAGKNDTDNDFIDDLITNNFITDCAAGDIPDQLIEYHFSQVREGEGFVNVGDVLHYDNVAVINGRQVDAVLTIDVINSTAAVGEQVQTRYKADTDTAIIRVEQGPAHSPNNYVSYHIDFVHHDDNSPAVYSFAYHGSDIDGGVGVRQEYMRLDSAEFAETMLNTPTNLLETTGATYREYRGTAVQNWEPESAAVGIYQNVSTIHLTVGQRDTRGGAGFRIFFERSNFTIPFCNGFDFGDAIGAGYATTTAAGASVTKHELLDGLFLGENVDIDNGLQEDTAANRDDISGIGDAASLDDEDAVASFPETITTTYELSVLTTNTTGGAAANLRAWIDFDHNGVFDADEASNAATVADGSDNTTTTLSWPNVPTDTLADNTYARIRYTQDPLVAGDATGAKSNGEVEDYQINLIPIGTVSGAVKDPSGNTVVGAKVKLVNPDGTAAVDASGTPIAEVTVDAVTGTYSFTNIPAGSYRIIETNPDNYLSTNETSDQAGDPQNTITTDDDIPITLTIGENDNDNIFIDTAMGVVAGTVYEDSNGNGIQDPGEPGIPGVTVTVTDMYGTDYTLTTDDNGNYAKKVPAGDTTIDIEESTIPSGFSRTEGDDPTVVTVPTGGIASDVDGFEPPDDAAKVEGVVYEDTNGNGTQDPGEIGIAGVIIVITDSGGNTQTLVTDENGEYGATVPPGATTVDVDETTLPGGSTQTEGTDPTSLTAVSGEVVRDVDGYEPPANAGSVEGVIYEDTNGNGTQDPGEPRIPGVAVEITDSAGNTQTVITNENGEYSAVVPAGDTTLNVDETTLPGGSTQTEGTDITVVTVPAGGTGHDVDGYQPPDDLGNLHGVVYEDTNGNGTQDPGEPGIAGVDVTITDSEGSIQTLVTDSNGEYATTVPAGETLVDIEQADINPLFARTEGTDPTKVTVPAGGTGSDVDGFQPPGVVAGTVYEDTNGNGVQDPGEPGIPNVSVLITDANGNEQILHTDENGNYAAKVPAGDTTINIDETTLPTGFTQTQGTDTTVVTVPAGGIASDVDGYEPPADAAKVEGVVYEDTNGNGVQDGDEQGIPGVTVTITDSAGNTQTLVTDENGEYGATVPPGATTVDVDETTLPGGSTQTEGTDPTSLTAVSGEVVRDVDGYQPPADAGKVEGVVYEDTNGNGQQDPGEPGIAGVEIEVTDSAGNTQTVITNANGEYSAVVPAGDTTLNVDETTLPGGSTQTEGTDVTVVTVPAGGTGHDVDGYQPPDQQGTLHGIVYEDTNGNGTQDAGEPGIPGVAVTVTDSEGNIQTLFTDENGEYSTTVPAGATLVDIEQADIDSSFTRTEGTDPTTVTVPAGGVGEDVDGFMPGGVVAGTVYEDTNGNGVQDPDEPGISGVAVVVTDVNGVPVTLTTDENGNYATQVPAGAATIDVDETTLPTGFTQTEGTDPTPVTVPAGGIASDVDGYQPPADAGKLEGVVYEDTNGNGQQDPGEPGISGVEIEVTDSAGNTQTVTTDEKGEYSATVPPGNTTVTIDETTLPGGSTQTEGGNPSTVTVPANGVGTDVDGFAPPADAGTVTGVIYEDLDGNGQQDPGEPGIPGVEIEVTDSAGNTQTVTTDENGNYTATVPPGDTTLNVVDETLPGGSTQTQGTDVTTVTVPAGGTATDIDGYAPSPESGRVEGVVYEDTNGNGTQDAGEPGIEGVHVTVTDSEGNIHTLITDADGKYGVTVPAGSALVDIEQSDINGNLVQTEGNDPTTVTVPAGGTATDVDGYGPGVIKLELIKFVSSVEDVNLNKRTDKGDIIHYSFTVTNTGDLSVTGITVTDPLVAVTGGPIVVLHAGQSDTTTFAATYTITQDDVKAGGVENIATVTGQDPVGDEVTDTSDAGTTPDQKPISNPGSSETENPLKIHPNDPADPTDDPTTLIFDDAFPWNLFMPAIMPHCPRIPDFCYLVADGDNEGSNDSPLFKYTFKSNQLELVNRLGAANVETMILSLDGKTIYATDDGIFGIIDPTPGMNDSFIPVDPLAQDAGFARGSIGTVAIRDIDGLSFDPVTGILYGSNRHETQSDLLIQLNPKTGKIIPNAFGSGIDYVVIDAESIGATDIDDIAVDSDGTLYGIAGNSGGVGNDHLVVIDKLTGAVTDRGPLGLENSLIQDMEGLTLHNHQTLFGTTGTEFASYGTANSLFKIDRATGETTFVSKLDQSLDGYVSTDFEGITCFPICK